MMYRIYDAETDERMNYPGFETLNEWQDYLDGIAEAWDIVDDSEEGTTYEVTLDGDETIWLIAVLEA